MATNTEIEKLIRITGKSKKSVPVETAPQLDSKGPTPQPFTKVTRRRRQRPSTPRKVLLLGDSHARGLAGLMQVQLGSRYRVESVVKPGGPLPYVLSEAAALSDGFGKTDHVIVLGGTNEIDKLSAHLPKVAGEIKGMRQTRVIMTDILRRHDTNKFEALREGLNERLRGNFAAIPHCTFFDPNPSLSRHLYTRHGLHLNAYGKEVLSSSLSAAIRRKDSRK